MNIDGISSGVSDEHNTLPSAKAVHNFVNAGVKTQTEISGTAIDWDLSCIFYKTLYTIPKINTFLNKNISFN